MLSNILNIYCKNIFNNFLIAESCRTCTHFFQKLPSPAPAPKSRNVPVLHRYSCKLGYRFLREEVDFNQLEEPLDYEKGLWKAVWSLDIPNKVKHLICRACKNSLPTKRNLARQQIINDHSYDRCSGGSEDIFHTVWSCAELDGV